MKIGLGISIGLGIAVMTKVPVGIWILATHRWRDRGAWVDTDYWKD